MKNKKITIIGLNFFPESTAIGLYSTQLAQYLETQGAYIEVITAFPYYPQWEIAENYKRKPTFLKEKLGSINIYRYKQYTPANPTFLKRIIHIIDFTFGSFINLWKIKECDIVISIVPFTSSGFLGYIQKKRFKAKSWIHIQDFEFDAAFQSGLAKSNHKKPSLIYRLLMAVERSVYNKADKVSTISHLMLQKLNSKTKTTTYFLPNWIDEKQIDPSISKQHPYLKTSKFKILYSGNIGDKQDWKFFMEFLNEIDPNRFEVVLVGDGSMRKQLEKDIAPFKNVSLYPPVPYEELSDLLCSADVHFLFQKEEVLDTVMPSKILGMMASAKPSIITGHPNSEVKKVIEESNGGFYISGSNLQEVLKSLETICLQKEKALQIGIKAREYVVNNFAKDKILSRFINELEQL